MFLQLGLHLGRKARMPLALAARCGGIAGRTVVRYLSGATPGSIGFRAIRATENNQKKDNVDCRQEYQNARNKL
jgi:hypothetical protein